MRKLAYLALFILGVCQQLPFQGKLTDFIYDQEIKAWNRKGIWFKWLAFREDRRF